MVLISLFRLLPGIVCVPCPIMECTCHTVSGALATAKQQQAAASSSAMESCWGAMEMCPVLGKLVPRLHEEVRVQTHGTTPGAPQVPGRIAQQHAAWHLGAEGLSAATALPPCRKRLHFGKASAVGKQMESIATRHKPSH